MTQKQLNQKAEKSRKAEGCKQCYTCDPAAWGIWYHCSGIGWTAWRWLWRDADLEVNSIYQIYNYRCSRKRPIGMQLFPHGLFCAILVIVLVFAWLEKEEFCNDYHTWACGFLHTVYGHYSIMIRLIFEAQRLSGAHSCTMKQQRKNWNVSCMEGTGPKSRGNPQSFSRELWIGNNSCWFCWNRKRNDLWYPRMLLLKNQMQVDDIYCFISGSLRSGIPATIRKFYHCKLWIIRIHWQHIWLHCCVIWRCSRWSFDILHIECPLYCRTYRRMCNPSIPIGQ